MAHIDLATMIIVEKIIVMETSLPHGFLRFLLVLLLYFNCPHAFFLLKLWSDFLSICNEATGVCPLVIYAFITLRFFHSPFMSKHRQEKEKKRKPHPCYTLQQNTQNVQPDAEYIKGRTTLVGRNFKRVTVLKFISR